MTDSMMGTILNHELRRRFASPITWLMFIGLAGYTAATMAGGETELLAGGGVPHNGSLLIYYWAMYSGFWVAVLGPILFAAPLLRDLQVRIAPLVFSKPLSDGDYFWGHYLASLIVAFVVLLSIPAAMIVTPAVVQALGYSELAFLPSTPWQHIGLATLIWIAPACFVYGSIHYATAAMSSRPMVSYAFSVLSMAVFTYFFVAFQGSGGHRFWIEVIDPMGKQTIDGQALLWSVAERGTHRLEATTSLVANRLLYLTAAAVILLCARWRFGLIPFLERARGVPRKVRPAKLRPITPGSSMTQAPIAPDSVSSLTRLAVYIGAWHVRVSTRSTVFRVVVAALLMIAMETGWSSAAEYFNPPENRMLPTAQFLLSVVEPQMFMLLIMVVIYFTGELVARDRDCRIAPLIESCPLPASLLPVARWIGATGLALLLACLPAIAVVLLQWANLWLEPFPGHFVRSVLLHSAPPVMAYAWLTVAIYGFTGRRLMSQGIPMAVLWASVALHEAGVIEQRLFLLGLPADLLFSDFDILAGSTTRHLALASYFLGITGLLVVFSMAWRARSGVSRNEDSQQNGRAKRKLSMLWGAVVFAAMAVGGAYSVLCELYVEHDAVSIAQNYDEQAAYEQRYGFLADMPPPAIKALRIEVDLHPETSTVDYTGQWTIENRGKEPLSVLYISYPENSTFLEARSDETPLTAVSSDEALRVVEYRLTSPLPPQGRASVSFRMRSRYAGFTYEAFEGSAGRGSVFLDRNALPKLGYDRERELTSRAQRRQRGLPAERHAIRMDDATFADGYGRMDVQTRIAAPETFQIASVGEHVSEEVSGGRRTVIATGQQVPFQFLVAAGRTDRRIAEWIAQRGTIPLALDRLPQHAGNDDRVLSATRMALTEFERRFSPYPYHAVHIAETGQFTIDDKPLGTRSAASLVVMPERQGWLDDYRKTPQRDYLTFTLATRLATAWWGNSVAASAGRGADVLDQGVPILLGLEIIAKVHGEQAAKDYVDLLREQLKRETSASESGVVDMLNTQFEPYAGLQAGIRLYDRRTQLGAERFDALLDDFYRSHVGKHEGLVRPIALTTALGM